MSFRPDPKPPKREVKKVYRLKRTPLKRSTKKIPVISSKRSVEKAVYDIRRPIFLRGKICPVTGEKATEVHHMKGRKGYADDWARENGITLYLDERFWLAVSIRGHKKIEANPTWAYKMGYSLLRIAK